MSCIPTFYLSFPGQWYVKRWTAFASVWHWHVVAFHTLAFVRHVHLSGMRMFLRYQNITLFQLSVYIHHTTKRCECSPPAGEIGVGYTNHTLELFWSCLWACVSPSNFVNVSKSKCLSEKSYLVARTFGSHDYILEGSELREAFFWFPSTHGRQNERAGGR